MVGLSVASVDAAIGRGSLSGLQIRVIVLCALILVFDGYDIGSISYAVPALAAAWKVPASDFTMAIVLGGVGMLIGSMISGLLGDWYGRKIVLVGCVTVFGIFSIASAFAESTITLALMRFITGLGLGGGVPTAIALTSDYVPNRNRALVVGAMTGAVPVGLVLGGLLSSKLIPMYGWEGIFLLGGILPLIVLPLLLLLLPESVQMLLAMGKREDKARALLKAMNLAPLFTEATAEPQSATRKVERNPIGKLFADGNAMRTALLWTMFLCNFLSTWLVIFWLPTILNAAGATPGSAAFYSALLPMGGIAGMIIIFFTAPRIGIEWMLTIGLLTGAAAVVALWSSAETTTVVAILIAVTGAGIQGAQFGMNGLSGAVYPPQIRATGSGWAFGIGRIGNVIGPALGGLVLGLSFPPRTMFLVAVVPLLIAAVATALLGRERSGGRLELTRAPAVL
jgi:AAHS family 4-hydroxybenzoate transporter-like MFS transporter